jgi:outer membrane protein assembly factor BamB
VSAARDWGAALAAVIVLSAREREARAQRVAPPSAPVIRVPEGAQFALDARHTGQSALRGPRTEPSIVWRVRARRRVFSSPVRTSAGLVAFAGVDGMLHAVDLEGVERWAFAAPGGVFSTAARVGELTVVGHGGGAFVALDPRGAVRWRVETEDDADASPAVGDDGSVYLAWRGVAAVEGATGVPRWRARGARVLGAPALTADGHVVYADVDGALVWLRVTDGVEARRARIGSLVDGSVLVTDDRAVIVGSEDGHVRRFSSQGALVWDVALGGPVRSTPALGRDATVIVGSDDLSIHGLDAATGARRWSVRTGGFVRASARVDRDGWIYVGSEDDRLYAIEPSGRVAWSALLGADIDASALLVSDGTLAVGCDDGGLYLLRERR